MKEVDQIKEVEKKIAGFPVLKDLALRTHTLILDSAPQLSTRLWYGMPGYALTPKSPVLCFIRVDDERFLTLGLTEHAQHIEVKGSNSTLMPCAWFITKLNKSTESQISEIVRSAVPNK